MVGLMYSLVSRMPDHLNRWPLYISRSKKMVDTGELDMVNLMAHFAVEMGEEVWSWSLSPDHRINTSSRKRSHKSGCGPCQVASAFSSRVARKRLAKGGAHLVPMATPFTWLKNLTEGIVLDHYF